MSRLNTNLEGKLLHQLFAFGSSHPSLRCVLSAGCIAILLDGSRLNEIGNESSGACLTCIAGPPLLIRLCLTTLLRLSSCMIAGGLCDSSHSLLSVFTESTTEPHSFGSAGDSVKSTFITGLRTHSYTALALGGIPTLSQVSTTWRRS